MESSIEKLDHSRVIVYYDWVPRALFTRLDHALTDQTSRKRLYHLRNPETPDAFRNLSYFIDLRLRIPSNTIVGERYNYNDKRSDQGRSLHLNSPLWHSQDLLTLTIKGVADVSFIDTRGEEQELYLRPNTLVRMHPDVIHELAPPKADASLQILQLGRTALS